MKKNRPHKGEYIQILGDNKKHKDYGSSVKEEYIGQVVKVAFVFTDSIQVKIHGKDYILLDGEYKLLNITWQFVLSLLFYNRRHGGDSNEKKELKNL